jgi:hypothetical protein
MATTKLVHHESKERNTSPHYPSTNPVSKSTKKRNRFISTHSPAPPPPGGGLNENPCIYSGVVHHLIASRYLLSNVLGGFVNVESLRNQ